MKQPRRRTKDPSGSLRRPKELTTASNTFAMVSFVAASAKSPRRESISARRRAFRAARVCFELPAVAVDLRAEVDAISITAFRLHPHLRARASRSRFLPSPDGSQRVSGHENDRRCAAASECQPLECVARHRSLVAWVAIPKTARPNTRSPGASGAYTRPNFFNDAANFVAKNARVGSIARIKCECLEHIAEIHSRCFHFDQHLARTARRQFKRREAERVETTALA